MSGSFWNDPVIILYLLIGILIVDNLWALYLLLREIILAYRTTEVPEVLRMYLTQDLFSAMRIYKLHKSCLIIVNTLFIVILSGCLELYFGFYPFLWKIANNCACFSWLKNEICISIIFVLLLSLYLTLKSLPATIYEKCCIRSLVNQVSPSWLSRILSEICDIIFSIILMGIVVSILILLVWHLKEFAFLGIYAVSVVLTMFLILLVPYFIDPFIGKRVELENLALKWKLEGLTQSVGFPMRQVHIIKVRDQNAGSNAFFYGSCCLKRIVIFDTLLLNRGLQDISQLPITDVGKGLQDHQVVAVVAHELGHWKNGHFYKAIIMFKVHLFLTLFLFALCFPHGPIYQAVGFKPGIQPIIVGFVIMFGFVMTPYITLSNVTMLSVTRQFEYQADKFAYKLGHAASLRHALLKLYADNLSFPISDECYSMWNHTHPTMLHRLSRLEQLEASGT